ncbi:hypothetical protein Cs7R123_64310 [Catellatospora sp. TT07R-123]|uniref:hypothetical protein n=1 Tax=Catellatospora sp. TT07R-123 TaxID=2733863 RepID=UPI001B01FD3E|nr:hypothetical protein [Catellatospora sp. TT07R-123]GHJ49089.1 hypothetical protein Cs7R123_64310 [Catellatospora sp. TT07R-123]
MAQRSGRSGCGCLLFLLLGPFVLSVLIAVPGTILASPAIVAYLLVRQPDQIAAYPSWWIGVALAPLVAYLVVRLAARGRAHAGQRIHLIRAGILTVLCTAVALTTLLLDQKYLGGTATPPAPTAAPEERLKQLSYSLPLIGPAAAALTALLCYGVLRLLDRKVAMRQPVVPRPQRSTGTSTWTPPEPRPKEIWWGEVEFREGEGSKDRPFVILRTFESHLEVLQITSQDKSHRDDHLEFRTTSDDPYAVEGGWLELRVRQLDRVDLRRQDAAYCPDDIWRQVRTLTMKGIPHNRAA